MRRALVHIGMPRTGTTTIQRTLHDRRAELAQHSLLYPDLTPATAAAPHLSHQHLGECLDGRRGRQERDQLLDALDRQLRGVQPETVLLSYEGLVVAPRRLALPQRLRAWFARRGYAMETLVTVKPQSEYLNSIYTWRTQFLKEARTFSRFLPDAMCWPQLDYETLIRPWRDACGGRVHVVPLRSVPDARPFVVRVAAACGLWPEHHVPPEPAGLSRLVENPSPSPVTVEAARRLRRYYANLWLGRRACEVTSRIEKLAAEQGLATGRFQGVGPAQAARIAAAFARQNRRFAAASWSGDWDQLVASEPYREVNELARGEIAPALDAAIGRLNREALSQHLRGMAVGVPRATAMYLSGLGHAG